MAEKTRKPSLEPPTVLPPLPDISVELLEDVSPPQSSGFMRLKRSRIRLRYPDGTRSEPMDYDEIDRRALDAVVIVAHHVVNGTRHVYLRSAVRPPVGMRARDPSRVPRATVGTGLWELPAGLVEPDEQTLAGTAVSAQRELLEELGFDVQVADLKLLGPPAFASPGMVAERYFFYEVIVDPERQGEPTLDGSPLERQAAIASIALPDALKAVETGEVEDVKTELALHRLQARFGTP